MQNARRQQHGPTCPVHPRHHGTRSRPEGERGARAGPPEIAVPSFAARSGFAGAAGYWLAVHVFRALTPAEGKALLTTLFLAHGALADACAAALDWTAPLAALAHAVARVPMPEGRAAASAAASVDSRPQLPESKKEK